MSSPHDRAHRSHADHRGDEGKKTVSKNGGVQAVVLNSKFKEYGSDCLGGTHPCQFRRVMDATNGKELRPHHVIVTQSLQPLVEESDSPKWRKPGQNQSLGARLKRKPVWQRQEIKNGSVRTDPGFKRSSSTQSSRSTAVIALVERLTGTVKTGPKPVPWRSSEKKAGAAETRDKLKTGSVWINQGYKRSFSTSSSRRIAALALAEPFRATNWSFYQGGRNSTPKST